MDIEKLSAKFHNIYQQEARRQGDVRHKDKYEDLSENIKEFDRVLARYVEKLLKAKEKKIKELEDKLKENQFEVIASGKVKIGVTSKEIFIRSKTGIVYFDSLVNNLREILKNNMENNIQIGVRVINENKR